MSSDYQPKCLSCVDGTVVSATVKRVCIAGWI